MRRRRVPQFWLIAGVNGSGKSTIVMRGGIREVLGEIDYINPDNFVPEIRAVRPDLSERDANILAAQRTEMLVDRNISERRSFAVETVLSTMKYLSRVETARSSGYFVGMIYMGLSDVELAIERVRERVARGGHNVPEERIRARWERSHHNLGEFARQLSKLFVYDNSDLKAPSLVARTHGKGPGVEILRPGLLPDVEIGLQGQVVQNSR